MPRLHCNHHYTNNKHTPKALSILTLLVLLLFNGCTKKASEKLRIATTSSMQYTMQQLTKEFTKQTGIVCEIITGSSGKLTALLKQGAPYDIFIAADLNYPEALFSSKLTIAPPEIYAYGELVLWTAKPDIVPTLEVLCQPRIRNIALANPRTAPYGQAAMEVLKNLDLLDSLSSKLIYGESVAQASQFIFSQAAAIGFTAKSVVMAPNLKDKGHWVTVNQRLYKPIAQGVVVLKNGNQQKAQQFYNFMFSDATTTILDTFGFSRTKPKQ